MQVRDYASGIGQAVADRTINRLKEDGSRETWGDVAHRVALGNTSLVPGRNSEYDVMHKHLAQASLLMSGRHLQHGDENQGQRPQEIMTNCSTAAASFLLFRLLLSGSGVGTDYSDHMQIVDWARTMPNVVVTIDPSHPDVLSGEIKAMSLRDAEHLYRFAKPTVHTVADSREGWAQAVQILEKITFYHKGNHVLILDFSAVRHRGQPIRGMQDRPASGPGPLMEAIRKIASVKGSGMRPWMATMFVDHYLAECVLVGGARRAARMATKYWKDADILDFIQLKRGGFLWSSNNSLLVDAEFWQMGPWAKAVFDAAIEAAYHDGTGEPGFINVDKLEFDPTGIEDYLDGSFVDIPEMAEYLAAKAAACIYGPYHVITNPCVTADTWIETSEGPRQVSDLIGVPYTAMVHGKPYAAPKGFWKTGEKPVYLVKTLKGQTLKATADHKILVVPDATNPLDQKWVEVKDLKENDLLVLNQPTAEIDYNHFTAPVESVTLVGTEPVYDCLVEEVHRFSANGVIVHNCGEIVLFLLAGYCVLADVVPFFAADDDDAEEAYRVATRALIRTNQMRSLYQKETKRTNRIGVGFTGIFEFALKRFGYGWHDLVDEAKSQDFWLLMRRFSEAVKDEAMLYAHELGVNVPHTATTVKPSGTTGKIFNLSEGAHLPAMLWYMRWVQFRNDDPLIKEYQDKGYPVRQLTTYSGTTIVGFPTKPAIVDLAEELGLVDKLVTAAQATPEEQFEWLRLLEKYWIGEKQGNQVSYTLKYDPKKVTFDEFKATVLANQPTVKCCSVMPGIDPKDSPYEYIPEEPVTKAYFEFLVSNIEAAANEDIDLESLKCASGACPI